MVYMLKTEKTLDDVKIELEVKAKREGFGVLKTYPFKKILLEKGFPIEKDITVYEICNPEAAQNILDIHPEVSVFLPCRISLFEEGGKTVISTISIDNILDSFVLGEDITLYMHTIFDKVKKIMKELV